MIKPIRNTEFIDDALSSGVDGDLVKYAVEYATTDVVNPNIRENSALGRDLMGDEFYDASGNRPDFGGDDFYDAKDIANDTFADDSIPDGYVGDEYSFYNSNGEAVIPKKKKGRKRTKVGKALRQAGKTALRTLTTPTGGRTSAGRMSATPPPPPRPKGWKGMSTGAKVAIIVGGLAVIGTAAYFIFKKK